MKKTFITSILVILLSNALYSLSTDEYLQGFSVQFAISEILTSDILNVYGYGIICGKYNFNPHHSVRINAGFQYTDDKVQTTGEAEQSRYSINLGTQYIYYITPERIIKVYIGIGIGGSTTFSSQTEGINSEYYNRYSIGGGVTIGLEWFASSSISFFTEIGAGTGYYWEYQENITRQGFSIGQVSPQLGLSIYL